MSNRAKLTVKNAPGCPRRRYFIVARLLVLPEIQSGLKRLCNWLIQKDLRGFSVGLGGAWRVVLHLVCYQLVTEDADGEITIMGRVCPA